MGSLEAVAKGLFDLKNQYGEDRVGISHRVYEAQEFVKQWSFTRHKTFSNSDIKILTEAQSLLSRGKKIFVIAYADRQEYELYQKEY